jgi:hypothetical protein
MLNELEAHYTAFPKAKSHRGQIPGVPELTLPVLERMGFH